MPSVLENSSQVHLMSAMVLSVQCRFKFRERQPCSEFLTGEELVDLDIRISEIRKESRGKPRKVR